MADFHIEVTDLVKTYQVTEAGVGLTNAIKNFVKPRQRAVHAVTGLSFVIERGEAVGYLGPNGAGKSTLIKIMTGIIEPTRGSVRVLGRVPYLERQANAKSIGVVFGQRTQLWWDLPVRDSFQLHQLLYDVEPVRFRSRCRELCELLGLMALLDRPVRLLSLGERMRAEIVLSLCHDPSILFLDEPTIGLDVFAKHSLRAALRQINTDLGTTIFLTTHDLQDIEAVCPRVIMVDRGTQLFDGSLAAFRQEVPQLKTLTLSFDRDPGAVLLEGAELIEGAGLIQRFSVDSAKVSARQLLGQLTTLPHLEDVSLEYPGIDEVVRAFYSARRGAA